MIRGLRALALRSLLRWVSDPTLEAHVRVRTSELAASVDLYRRLIEESTEGILIHQDGAIRFANQAMMKDDRERCLAAGMDDYLSKPIRRDQLAAVLARVAGAVEAMPGERHR